MAGSNSSPCAGQKSSRPSLRVVTSSSPSTQNQVSSSMAPPPRPVINGTWIQPYGLPANAPPANPHPLLANSGISVMTNYPLSTSPRQTAQAINRHLGLTSLSSKETNQRLETTGPRMKIGAPVGMFKSKVVSTEPDFQSFSWDSTTQPRTAAARARGSNDNVSPRTKEQGESNKKRKHSEMSKE